MSFERTMGPIPERIIDPAIARDTEIDWNRLLNKPSSFPPSTHIHSQYVDLTTEQTLTALKQLTGITCLQIPNPSTNPIINQPANNNGSLTLLADKNNNAPVFITFHIPNRVASYLGIDTDGVFSFGGWTYSGRYAPVRTGYIQITGSNSYEASLRIINGSKTENTEINQWIFYNTKAGNPDFPQQAGLHLYSYNSTRTLILNPFSVLDDGTTVINNLRANIQTQVRSNFSSAEGNKSGFYETNATSSTNTPLGNYWHHLIECRHTNTNTNYALQISSSFFLQRLFFRILNNNPSQSWLELLHFGNRFESWQQPTFTADFQNYADTSTIQPLRFRRNNASNSVEIIGSIFNTTSTINTSVWYNAFTLPGGFRPTKSRIFPLKIDNVLGGSLEIESTGNCRVMSERVNRSANSRWSIEINMPLV